MKRLTVKKMFFNVNLVFLIHFYIILIDSKVLETFFGKNSFP